MIARFWLGEALDIQSRSKQPMIITIENEHLRVAISTLGAELYAVERRGDGHSYLWHGDPEAWPDRSPVLFPIVGRLHGGRYSLRDRTYAMDIHGFALRSEFAVALREKDAVVLTMQDSAETRANYPFSFTFSLRYALRGDTLVKEHLVHNAGSQPMPYEVGGHEGYRITHPLEEVQLLFDGAEHISVYGCDENGMLDAAPHEVPLDRGRLPLSLARFAESSFLTVTDLASAKVLLRDGDSPSYVEVTFPDFPYLGIWTNRAVLHPGYLCVEPWSALPDGLHSDPNLLRKPGIRLAAPGETQALRYEMRFGG